MKHELGWADFQTRSAEAIIRHRHLVMLAFTFSLLTEAPPAGWVRDATQKAAGKQSVVRIVWQETLRHARGWLCPWAQITRYWQSWSHVPPPPELAALLAHVAHSHPVDAPT